MNVGGIPLRTIGFSERGDGVCIIDQRRLPHELVWEELRAVDEMATAIRDMHVRGAPLIGAAAAYGMWLAAREAQGTTDFQSALRARAALLRATRPTAVNLMWAIDRQLDAMAHALTGNEAVAIARRTAVAIADADVDQCRRIGEHGLVLLEEIARRKGRVEILTHCNAGWLACVDYGTATSPIYQAFDRGLDIHVWVDETRPRSQGARLTAWELGQHGIPHTVIADNAGGHLMQHGRVDLVIVGSDRTTRTGDVANKIGTYLKALAAHDNGVPFYVALPSTTFDPTLRDGVREIPIEERDGREVTHVDGWCEDGWREVRVVPEGCHAANPGFDVTPARLVTGLITERGICAASEPGILGLFPEFARGD